MQHCRAPVIFVCFLFGATSSLGQGWQIASGIAADLLRPKLTIRNASGASRHVSHDERLERLTLVMDDDTVRLWDLRSGVQLATVEAPRGRVSVATPVPDGRRIVLGDRRGDVHVAALRLPGVMQELIHQLPRLVPAHVLSLQDSTDADDQTRFGRVRDTQ